MHKGNRKAGVGEQCIAQLAQKMSQTGELAADAGAAVDMCKAPHSSLREACLLSSASTRCLLETLSRRACCSSPQCITQHLENPACQLERSVECSVCMCKCNLCGCTLFTLWLVLSTASVPHIAQVAGILCRGLMRSQILCRAAQAGDAATEAVAKAGGSGPFDSLAHLFEGLLTVRMLLTGAFDTDSAALYRTNAHVVRCRTHRVCADSVCCELHMLLCMRLRLHALKPPSSQVRQHI